MNQYNVFFVLFFLQMTTPLYILCLGSLPFFLLSFDFCRKYIKLATNLAKHKYSHGIGLCVCCSICCASPNLKSNHFKEWNVRVFPLINRKLLTDFCVISDLTGFMVVHKFDLFVNVVNHLSFSLEQISVLPVWFTHIVFLNAT